MLGYVKEIIDEAKQAGIKDIVYHHETTNSSEEIKDYIIKSGIPYTIIKSNGFMQDYAHLLGDIMNLKLILLILGTQAQCLLKH